MNTDEIFDNRRAIAKKICKAIRYNGGQLLNARFFPERPFCDDENSYKFLNPPRRYRFLQNLIGFWQVLKNGVTTLKIAPFLHAYRMPYSVVQLFFSKNQVKN